MQSKGGIAVEKRWVLMVRKLGLGFEGVGVRKTKKKMSKRRVEVKSKNRNFGERNLVGLSLFQAFAMEKDCGKDQRFCYGRGIFSRK